MSYLPPVTLTFKDSLTFRVELGPRDTDLAKSVPGLSAHKFDQRSGTVEWSCPATWYHANLLRSVFGDRLEGGVEVMSWGAQQAVAELERLAVKTTPVRPGGPLYDFQKTGVNWLYEHHALLADDMGLGKTVQALQALEVDTVKKWGDALVVTTNSMKFKWAEEAKIWAPSWSSVVVVDGSADKRRKQIVSAPAHTLFVINWESLRLHTRLSGYGSIALDSEARKLKEFNARDIQYVIADEAHKAKDPHAAQTRALWWVGRKASRRWAMTGTPLANEYADLWSLLHWLQPTWFPSRQEFIDRYTYGYTTDYGYTPVGWNARNKAELFRFLDLLMLRRSKTEVLPQLPAKTYETRELELTPKQKTIYKALKKEALAVIDGGLLTATDELSLRIRLSQTASAVPVIDGGEVIALSKPSNKVSALLEIIEEGGGPLVVFAESKKLINLVGEELTKKGIEYVRVTGDEPSELRSINVQRFQEGAVPVVLCTFGAGSEGITLTAASTAVFLQRPWSLVQSRQAEDRIHRIGQDRPVLIIDLVSAGTMDVAVVEALVKKGVALESVTRDKLREML